MNLMHVDNQGKYSLKYATSKIDIDFINNDRQKEKINFYWQLHILTIHKGF